MPTTSVSVQELPTVTLYADNRHNGRAGWKCGELSFPVQADGGYVRTTPAPPRPDEYPLTVGGGAVGEPDGPH